MSMLLFVLLCCHHGHADSAKVEVMEAVLSSLFESRFPASRCINNVTKGKVSYLLKDGGRFSSVHYLSI